MQSGVSLDKLLGCVGASSPDLTGFRNLSGLSRSDRQDHINIA